MKVIFAGSGMLDLKESAEHLLQQLAALPPNTTVLLRRPRFSLPGGFEMLSKNLCESLDIPVEWRIPEEGGRSATYLRDISMVQAADAVVCYFHPDAIMDGGTGHLAEKALDQEKPLYTYAAVEPGQVEWIGGIEPSNPLGK